MTSVPPTQPPAAPETDVSTPRPWPADSWPTAAELADWLSRCTSDERLSYADHSLATAQRAARCVDRHHAARFERDAVVEVGAYAQQKEATARAVNNAARMARVAARRTRELAAMTARAESAEAAHRALQAAVEALADEWAEDYPGPTAACNRTPDEWARDLHALLAGGAR